MINILLIKQSIDNFYFKDKNLTFDSSTFENEDNP